MSFLLTAVFENGFQEIYLPNVDNKTLPVAIRPHISGHGEDIALPLEVWDGVWTLNSSRQFALTRDEQALDKARLAPGMLLNAELAKSDAMFSLTVDEVQDGNTRFDKFFLDAKSCPRVGIGSGADNAVVYAYQFCSPHHAEILLDGNAAYIEDRNSVNGTFVNGRRLQKRHALRYGDIIYIVGLKLVYLGNVLAVNNPGGHRKADERHLKPIRIAPAPEQAEAREREAAEEDFFLRAPRKLERLDDEAFSIEKCPQRNEQKRQPLLLTIGPSFTMMIPMAAGAMILGSENGSIASGLIMTVGSALMAGMWAVLNIRYQSNEESKAEQKRVSEYTAYINNLAARLMEKQAYNKGVLTRMMPSAAEAIGFALQASPRLWEKSAAHEDFLFVRIGRGNMPSPNPVSAAKEQVLSAHDPLNDMAERLRLDMAELRDVPVGFSLYENRMAGVVGDARAKAVRIAGQVCAQVAGLHPYTDVRMCFVYPMRELDSWTYARFLPHVWTPDGKLRMIAHDKNSVGDVMYHLSGVIRSRMESEGTPAEEGQKILPHYVVVVADWSLIEEEPIAKYLMNPAPELGISVICLADAVDRLPAGCTAILRDDAQMQGFYSIAGVFAQRERVVFDALDPAQMDAFARALSNFHVRETGASAAIPDMLTFLDLYKTSRVEELDILHRWLENRTYESMKSLIGHKSGNQPLYLDIHEKFHGPHGLVAGTTGSGKSETLQSYILSLAVNYHPHEVAFILIDYKGGGMAQSFVGLPHLSGVITNLGGNATNRALLSINAEIKSRQRMFNEYKVKHIDAYIELYRAGTAIEPMPHLLIIADEFAELKKEQPEFVRALVSAARVGRSLGVNLILATQKPSGVVDDEIWSNTRFRLCLRVADKQDSNEMLKRPDAAFITGTGRGYFQVGSDEIFEEFQSGWSGAEYEPDVPFAGDRSARAELITLVGKSGAPVKKKKKKSDNIAKVTQLDAVVQYTAQLAGENSIPPVKQIWLPPLPRAVYLDNLPALKKPEGFSLLLPLGLADAPEEQRQFPCAVDFLADGHLLVCGAGGAGKTTLLQTLIYGAVTRYTPQEVNLYIADFSSRTMAVFASLPHVGGVFFEGEDEKIADVFALLKNTLSARKSEFSAQGVSSFREYAAQKGDCPAILFMIDNYVAFMESYDRYEDDLAALSREAASYGIYLVLTMNNAGELRSRIRQNLTAGIGLQMPDRFEYEAVVGGRAEMLPEARTPGRGLIKTPAPLEFQVALCVREDAGLSQAQTLRRRFAAVQGTQGQGAKKIGATIESLGYDALMGRSDVKGLSQNLIALGLNAEDGALVTADLDNEFCFTVSGAGATGKTNFLAAVALQARQKGARLFLFDTPGGPLEGTLPFERAAHDDAELFALMEEMLVPAFSARNAVVADARDAGGDIAAALSDDARIVFLINDMRAFMQAVYSPDLQMSDFMEIALQKGRQHKIQFFAAVTPDDYTDTARYAAMRIFAGYGRGIHLGGMFDQQSILRFPLSAADAVRQLPPGVAYAAAGGETVRLITPCVKEVCAHE
ncbi:MAG TPA: type VII secretion protein EssC [Feifaniaceae bacterium]|nr:type VII secretion protein EssC [Feifaniaceae bacterium]